MKKSIDKCAIVADNESRSGGETADKSKTGRPGRGKRMEKKRFTIEGIKEVIFENARGNVLERAYLGLQHQIEIAEKFPAERVWVLENVHCYWVFDCTKEEIIREMVSLGIAS